MHCLICSQSCSKFIDHKSNINYFECSKCQVIMKSSENFYNFEQQKERYDLHTNHEEAKGYRAYFQRFIDFIDIDTDREKRALDFGCGASVLLSKMLSSNGIECDVYDPIYHPNEEFKERSYDLILSVEVFEHLHDPKSIFQMLVEHLNRDGYLAIQTAFYLNDRDKFLQWHYRLDPTHVIFFSPKTFEILADQFGLKVIKCNSKNIILMQKISD